MSLAIPLPLRIALCLYQKGLHIFPQEHLFIYFPCFHCLPVASVSLNILLRQRYVLVIIALPIPGWQLYSIQIHSKQNTDFVFFVHLPQFMSHYTLFTFVILLFQRHPSLIMVYKGIMKSSRRLNYLFSLLTSLSFHSLFLIPLTSWSCKTTLLDNWACGSWQEAGAWSMFLETKSIFLSRRVDSNFTGPSVRTCRSA